MPPSPDDAKSLQISASPQQALTPAQQAFNQWIAKIAALRAEVVAEQQKLEALRECADKHLVPAYRKIARVKVELAMALEQAVLANPVGKRQQQEIGTCIAALCRQAFAIIDPSAEEVALQD
ncbi:MAG TPA: hypothetical protein VHS96_17845, partial [Bacteroidia bacterium]|nr:hypothetical protein [Bacteroidia bacterium]